MGLKSFSAALIFALSIGGGACYAAPTPPWLPGLRLDPPAEECRAYHWKLVKELRKSKPDVLFLGDSITGNWMDYGRPAWDKYLQPLGSFNIGIAGEITQSILWRLERGAVDNVSPKIVVLMIGTNNLVGDTPADTVRGVKAIISVLRKKLPESKILLLGILPRQSKAAPGDLQQKIVQANNLLSKVQDDKVYFLDLGSITVNGSSDFFVDGVHPSLAGYERMGPPLARAIEKLKARNATIAHNMHVQSL